MTQATNIVFSTFNANKQGWKEAFNQCTFFNYDLNFPVTINKIYVIPPAILHPNGVDIIPSFLEISLNQGEVNRTYYNFGFDKSTTAKLVIIHSEYHGDQK